MPSIRTELLLGVYNSIAESFHGEWELVIVGPTFPESLKDHKNVKFIQSWASPLCCRQQGLLICEGEYICYAADDVTFLTRALDIAYHTISVDGNYKMVVVGKYLEGSQVNPQMQADPYWYLWTHVGLRSILNREEMKEYFLINTGLVSRKLMIEVGGWDCQLFEACAMGCVDLSIRLQNYGAKCVLQDEAIFHSTHLPGMAGDHGPIDRAQITADEPKFFEIWSTHGAKFRSVINIDNWKKCPSRWERRFGAAA